VQKNEEQIIQTIRSRCQILHFLLAEEAIPKALIEKGVSREDALRLSHEAMVISNKAGWIYDNDSEDLYLRSGFVQWYEVPLKPRVNKQQFINLILEWKWWPKRVRKHKKNSWIICNVCHEASPFINYNTRDWHLWGFHVGFFQWKKFSTFVHENNIVFNKWKNWDAPFINWKKW